MINCRQVVPGEAHHIIDDMIVVHTDDFSLRKCGYDQRYSRHCLKCADELDDVFEAVILENYRRLYV